MWEIYAFNSCNMSRGTDGKLKKELEFRLANHRMRLQVSEQTLTRIAGRFFLHIPANSLPTASFSCMYLSSSIAARVSLCGTKRN